MTARTHKREA